MIKLDGIKIISQEEKNDGVFIPRYIIDQTLEYVQYWGKKKQEALLFWAGIKNSQSTFVTTCIFPKAHAQAVTINTNPCQATNPPNDDYIKHMHEPCIKLDTVEAAKVISEAGKRNLMIVAQVHSHEHAAYHSPIDEKNPFDSSEGFLSIVISEFGNQNTIFLSSCAIYQCGADEKFYKLSPQEIEKTFKVIDSGIHL